MTQFSPTGHPPPVPVKTHGLAVAALVCSLLVFIPYIAPLLGLVFGFIALIIVSTSGGATRGKGMAAAAMAISAIVLTLHIWLTVFALQKGMGFVQGMFFDSAERFVRAIEAGDLTAARAELYEPEVAKLTDDELQRARKKFAKDYGEFQDIKFDLYAQAYQRGVKPPAGYNPNQTGKPPSSVSGHGEFPVAFVFSNATVPGVMEFDDNESTTAPSGMPSMKVVSLTFVDADGTWTIPAAAATTRNAEDADEDDSADHEDSAAGEDAAADADAAEDDADSPGSDDE